MRVDALMCEVENVKCSCQVEVEKWVETSCRTQFKYLHLRPSCAHTELFFCHQTSELRCLLQPAISVVK